MARDERTPTPNTSGNVGMTRRQWVTLATVGSAGAMLPLSWPQAAQSVPVTIRYNRVRHIKNLIPALVQGDKFFHQPHGGGETLAGQLFRGLYNQAEPRQADIRWITNTLNYIGPERAIQTMVMSKEFDSIRRPPDWAHRVQFEKNTWRSRNAAYLNSRLERVHLALYGRLPTAFELNDMLQSLLVPVRTERLLVSARPNSLISTAYAQDAGDGGWPVTVTTDNSVTTVTEGWFTITFDAEKALTLAMIGQIAAAGKLAVVAGILLTVGVGLWSTAPLTAVTVGVIGTVIFLTSLIPFSVGVYGLSGGFDVTMHSEPSTAGPAPSAEGDPSTPPPSDPPPSDPGPPPGATMNLSISIAGDSVSATSGDDPGDPGDGNADGGGAAGTDSGPGDGW